MKIMAHVENERKAEKKLLYLYKNWRELMMTNAKLDPLWIQINNGAVILFFRLKLKTHLHKSLT